MLDSIQAARRAAADVARSLLQGAAALVILLAITHPIASAALAVWGIATTGGIVGAHVALAIIPHR
ncbi:MAG TPA: hypothetical protein VD860_12220 [Azospirillum sp.]|nr:hypothetical protein [Azospirillum sp.]